MSSVPSLNVYVWIVGAAFFDVAATLFVVALWKSPRARSKPPRGRHREL